VRQRLFVLVAGIVLGAVAAAAAFGATGDIWTLSLTMPDPTYLGAQSLDGGFNGGAGPGENVAYWNDAETAGMLKDTASSATYYFTSTVDEMGASNTHFCCQIVGDGAFKLYNHQGGSLLCRGQMSFERWHEDLGPELYYQGILTFAKANSCPLSHSEQAFWGSAPAGTNPQTPVFEFEQAASRT
jgi:hypothetical protein